MDARVVIGGNRERGASETGGLYQLARALVFGFGDAPFVKDQGLAGGGSGASSHLSEERGKTVIVLLTPAFEGMVVALCAAHANAKEELRNVLQLLFGGLYLVVPSDGWVRDGVPCGGEKFANHLVIRLVGEESVAKPGVEGETGFGTFVDALVAQDSRPLICEKVCIFRTREEGVDESIPLVRAGVCEEGSGFLGGRDFARDVEGRAADEGGVVAERRGRNAEALEVGEDEVVDEVFRGGNGGNGRALWECGGVNTDEALVADHDGCVAR